MPADRKINRDISSRKNPLSPDEVQESVNQDFRLWGYQLTCRGVFLIPSARSLTLKLARISQLVLTKLDDHCHQLSRLYSEACPLASLFLTEILFGPTAIFASESYEVRLRFAGFVRCYHH
jgi:hypothetical protein